MSNAEQHTTDEPEPLRFQWETFEFGTHEHVLHVNRDMAPHQLELGSNLRVVRGVEWIRFRSYSVRICRGALFHWAPIHEAVEQVLRDVLDPPTTTATDENATQRADPTT